MRPALGDVGKAGKIYGLRPVVHIGLENEIVPAFPRWPEFHVVFVIFDARRFGKRTVVRPWMQHNVWRRKKDMLRATVDRRWEYTRGPQPFG